MDYRKAIWNESTRLAGIAFTDYCQNIHQYLYLAGDSVDGVFDNLRIVNDSCEHDYNLIANDHIPRNMTTEQMATWICDQFNHTPLAIVRDSY